MKIKTIIGVVAESQRFERSIALSGAQIDPVAVSAALDKCKERILADIQKAQNPPKK